MTNYKRNFLRALPRGIIFLCPLLFAACSTARYTRSINYQFSGNSNRPDYSNPDYWAASPFKYDPSDNTPSGGIDTSHAVEADVFFIHPTTYTDPKMPMGWNADIDNEALNRKTDASTILYQASVFNRYARVFAPRYRQANLKAFYTTDTLRAEAAFDTAYADVRNAFLYYLHHYNHGRPIIIASHSQGTLHAGRLLKEFFENKPLGKQLVCAYVIGLPVFVNYFHYLKPCEDSTQTGCFVSWRTFQQGYSAPYIKKETLKAYVTNPLTWNSDTILAPSCLNLGGVLRRFRKIIPGVVHARIHGNILWVNKPKFFGAIFLKTHNYHIADYNLFYENIRENTGARIRSFMDSRKLAGTAP
ncbi:MAG: DUF3089 domain-containing protein [Bacteroidota bacterium]|nr:DUF3089 domain-containing protein [Bacteroidota bacterium]